MAVLLVVPLALSAAVPQELVASQVQEALDRCVQAAGEGKTSPFLQNGVALFRPRLLPNYADCLARGSLAPGLREVVLEVQDVEEGRWGSAARTEATFPLGRQISLRIPFVIEEENIRIELLPLQLLAYWGYEWRKEVENWRKQANWHRRDWEPGPPPWPPREDAAWLLASHMEECAYMLPELPPEVVSPLHRAGFDLGTLEEYARILERLDDSREEYNLSLIMALRGSRCALARALELLPDQARMGNFEDWFFGVSFPFSWPHVTADVDFSEHDREVLRSFALKMDGEPRLVDVLYSKEGSVFSVKPWKDGHPSPVRIDKEDSAVGGFALGVVVGLALAAFSYLAARFLKKRRRERE